jgi:YidC/Oxa1 family membrane protein insertase
MNIRRIVSYAAVAVLGALLWTTWTKEEAARVPAVNAAANLAANSAANNPQSRSADFAPTVSATAASSSSAAPSNAASVGEGTQTIRLTTDVLSLAINLNGAQVLESHLLTYPQSTTDKMPVQILSDQLDNLYLADSGVANNQPIKYQTLGGAGGKSAHFVLQDGQKELVVSLVGKTDNGLDVTKTFHLNRGQYAVRVETTLNNATRSSWTGQLYSQLVRKKPDEAGHLFYARSYDGAAVSSPDRPYYKLNYGDMDKKPYASQNTGGWVAMQQHYFLTAWVPSDAAAMHQYYSRVTALPNGVPIYTVGYLSAPLSLAPGQSTSLSSQLYIGPEIQENLAALAPGLDRTIDYGWLWWVSEAIFALMRGLHHVLANWGWTIVVTTIIIKMLLYPLSAASFRSMARMRELQPKMQQLKERFGDDRQALGRATMELYREQQINPLGGCLPMLIQIPIFIALYYVIIESVQLRQAPFIGWIVDLSVKDPYYVLPILMGVSMLIQQKLSPSSPDPTQARIMMVMPVIFTVFFVNFPAGLTLYWLVNNCVQILQQYYVTKTFDAHQAKRKQRKNQAKLARSIGKK